jgi:hypothetical protein
MAKKGRIIREAAVWRKAEKADSPVKVHSRTYGIKAKYAGKLRRDYKSPKADSPYVQQSYLKLALASSPFPHL